MNHSSTHDASSPDASSDEGGGTPDYTRRILKGGGSVFSGSLIAKAVGFALQVVLGRGFGKGLYGIYSYGLSLLRIVRELSTIGLQNGVVRFGAEHSENEDTAALKGTFLAVGGLGTGAGVLMGAALYLAAPWLTEVALSNTNDPLVFQLFAVGLPFYVLTYLGSRMARALGKMRVDVLLDSILQPALFLLLTGIILLFGWGFTAALYAFVASTALAAGASVYAVYRLFPPLFSSLAPTVDLRRLLRFSLPIVGVSLASMGLARADRIMLGPLAGEEAVGLYTAASKMSVQLRFVLFALTAAFSPVISELYHSDRTDELARLYADTVRWIALGTLPLAVVLIVFAPDIMAIFGPEFREGAILLRVLAGAYIVVAGSGSVGHMLQMSDHQDFTFWVNASMAVLNVGLNWILIQWYGVVGAAIATGTTHILGNLFQLWGLYHFTHIQPFRWNLWKPLVAAGASGGTAWMLFVQLASSGRWLIGIPAALLVYGSVLLALGLSPRDQAIADNLWSELRARLDT
ncbi:flippase [Salinibacter altiplanensis]|uniref:flippase n=1 Tax=Salinibacter altiplanensis TaxID=1803181 RepID=UPI000C9F8E77|nr:flippase [Salinibacter altiplanensis]